MRGQDHVGGEILVERAQPVADPRPDARTRKRYRTSMDAKRGFEMISVVRPHRANHAKVIHHPGHVRKEIAHLGATLAMGFEIPAWLL